MKNIKKHINLVYFYTNILLKSSKNENHLIPTGSVIKIIFVFVFINTFKNFIFFHSISSPMDGCVLLI